MQPGRLDAEALGDLAHDVRNSFHKLYYLAEVLGADAEADADEAPGAMLGRVVRDLDQMFQEALDYVRPLSVSPISISGAELAAGLESWLRRDAEGSEIGVSAAPEVASVALRVDPGQLPRALGLVVRELARGASESGRLATASASLRVTSDPARVEIRLEVAAGPDERPPRKARRLLPWAMARRVIELHGGEIAPCGDEGAARGCVIALPLCG